MVINHVDNNLSLEKDRGLGSVTPTLLNLMNIPIPGNMEEETLIVK